MRSEATAHVASRSRSFSLAEMQSLSQSSLSTLEDETQRKPYKGLIRSLQQIGCRHVLELYCQGLTSGKGQFQQDLEFKELQVHILIPFVSFYYGWLINFLSVLSVGM